MPSSRCVVCWRNLAWWWRGVCSQQAAALLCTTGEQAQLTRATAVATLRVLAQEADTDGNGCIELDEFQALCARHLYDSNGVML